MKICSTKKKDTCSESTNEIMQHSGKLETKDARVCARGRVHMIEKLK